MKGLTDGFGVGMMFPSTEVTLEEEEFVYPFVSFVAEFGGALGLFLGFSFLMVWDFVHCIIITAPRYMKWAGQAGGCWCIRNKFKLPT